MFILSTFLLIHGMSFLVWLPFSNSNGDPLVVECGVILSVVYKKSTEFLLPIAMFSHESTHSVVQCFHKTYSVTNATWALCSDLLDVYPPINFDQNLYKPSSSLTPVYSPNWNRNWNITPMHQLDKTLLQPVLECLDLPLEGLWCSQAEILPHDPFMTPFILVPLIGTI